MNVPAHPHHRITEHTFEKLLTAYIKLYCTSTDPKGDVITYLKSNNARKPKETSVSDHQDRMEEIMRYSTYLEGARNNLSEDKMKTILFNSFPDQWQINYQRSQPPLQQTTIERVMIFMSQEKEFSDSSKKQSNQWQDRGGGGRGRGRGRGLARGRGKQGRGDKERCRNHHGKHLWKECPSNYKGTCYDGSGRGRGRSRGRGGQNDSQSYHTQQQSYAHLPPPPGQQKNLPPPPVVSVTVGPAEAHYVNQFGGGQSVGGYSQVTSSTIQAQGNDFYMANDGKFYRK